LKARVLLARKHRSCNSSLSDRDEGLLANSEEKSPRLKTRATTTGIRIEDADRAFSYWFVRHAIVDNISSSLA
jgi:hypothetical protein